MDLLTGVKVVEVGQAIQAATAACVLGDLGADVIKVENRDGDAQRYTRTIMGTPMELPGGRNASFEPINRNKRSITLNLATEEGRRILYQLVAGADVFVTNSVKAVRDKLRIDFVTLKSHNPRLVYAVGGGYGELGPSAAEDTYDNAAFARSGMMYLVGDENGAPQYMVPGAGDVMAGTMLALAATSALFRRSQTGEAQLVESSLLGSLVHYMTIPLSMSLLADRTPKRPLRTKMFNPLVGWYRSADDRWLMLSLNFPQRDWHQFCLAIGTPELEEDPKFSSIRSRGDNCEALGRILDRTFATRDREYWLGRLRAAGLICSPVNSPADLGVDPQITMNGYIAEVEHPTLGKTKMIHLPIKSRGVGPATRIVAPELGQHAEEILSELGYTWEEIVGLREREVI